MKILVLNGSPHKDGNTTALVSAFQKGAQAAGHEVVVCPVGTMNIKGCLGCEYCHTKGEGTCIQKDDSVHYFGFTGQMECTLSRFYAGMKPAKAAKYGLILSSGSPNVYAAIEAQYKSVISLCGGEDAGIITCAGAENKTEAALAKAEEFGKSL